MKATSKWKGSARKLNGVLLRTIIVAGFLFCEAIALAQSPGSAPTNAVLQSWSFYNQTNWTDDAGAPPISFSNICSSPLGDGQSLVVDTNIPAWLQYNVVENDGITNLPVEVGTLSFWFGADWSTTNGGPGQWAQLIDVGEWTTNSSYGYWGLSVDPPGQNLWFMSQDGAGNTYTLSTPVSWTTNFFHFIALTFCSTNTALYVDGVLMTNDPGGLSIWPNSEVLSNGVFFGSDTNGQFQAHGLFDTIYTYSYPLDSNDIESNYQWEWGYNNYQINPLNSAMNESIEPASSDPASAPPYYDAITGMGNLQLVSSATSGANGTNAYNVWITNVLATVTSGSGTNSIMNVTFTIEGGSNSVPYDVFANSVLSFGTNGVPWSWMGQGTHWNTYMLTNIPGPYCYLILGTPQDSDGNGLTDAYELLVSKTNPNVDDQDNAGIPDSWQVLLGLNPLMNQVAQMSTRSNYSYTLADWLQGVSNARTGTVSLDNEGNVLTVSQ
jgi:hypothetical protein